MQNASRVANIRLFLPRGRLRGHFSRGSDLRSPAPCLQLREFSSGFDVEESSAKTITKKAFPDLPKIGEQSKILKPWNGGLNSPKLPVQATEIKEGSPTSVTSRPKRTRRRAVTEHSESKESEGGNSESENAKLDSPISVLDFGRREPRKQLAEEIKDNLARFPDCILLTRVGQFYESIFDQAQEVAAMLSIKLAKRNFKSGPVWMCGFPLSHLDKHLRTLVQKHNRPVALCEEFVKQRRTSSCKPLFERRVVRILTPGTLIDESFLNPYVNNFLLCISLPKGNSLGLAWIDVSTGEFSAVETSLATFPDHLARINPREVILDSTLKGDAEDSVKKILTEEKSLISYVDGDAHEYVSSNVPQDETSIRIECPGTGCSEKEKEAISLLTRYLRGHLLDHAPESLMLSREHLADRMQIDAHTLKALEIKENLGDGGTYGSLMSTINRTVTSSGSRLLSRWLCSPSFSLDVLTARQDLVEIFHGMPWLRQDVVHQLKRAGDALKILQRFTLGRGDVDDLLQIKQTIQVWEDIHLRISQERASLPATTNGAAQNKWKRLDSVAAKIPDLKDLVERIDLAIESNPAEETSPSAVELDENTAIVDDTASPNTTFAAPDTRWKLIAILAGDRVTWRMRPQFSDDLNRLHEQLRDLQSEKKALEARFQNQYAAPSLSLRFSASHGVHVHIARPKRDCELISKSHVFHKMSESSSTRTYFNEEWSRIGNTITEVVSSIYKAEKDAFELLRAETISQATGIRRAGRIMDELDVTSAFATLASELHLVRPLLTTSNSMEIVDGRHPTVEIGLLAAGRNFTSNSVTMHESSRLHIITGPNMAGKSTFLRQIALITILAQIGSFVPARYANLGLVDKLFSRVGAKDDLFRDHSTFMVEMLETANILKNATSRSLVIMDEVGRGTTMTDGLAIAFAVVCHMYFQNRCRALFATHFHEIVDMLGVTSCGTESLNLPAVKYFCTDVGETDGRFAYSHVMRPGVNRLAHGLKVAQLSDMPPFAMQIASDALSAISKSGDSPLGSSRQAGRDHLQTVGEDMIRRLSAYMYSK